MLWTYTRFISTRYYSFHGSIYYNCKRKRKDHTSTERNEKKKRLNKRIWIPNWLKLEKCHWLTMAYGLKMIAIDFCLHFFENSHTHSTWPWCKEWKKINRFRLRLFQWRWNFIKESMAQKWSHNDVMVPSQPAMHELLHEIKMLKTDATSFVQRYICKSNRDYSKHIANFK